MFAREEYKKVLTIFPNDNKDYFHLINGLKEVMKIENLDFKALCLNGENLSFNGTALNKVDIEGFLS